jgi:hypothetical protein
VFANFAELRTYVYSAARSIGRCHFGYDLASTRQSAVPAANKGVVVFAEPLTIYGNTVVIDHGLGLQTLYAHLSSHGREGRRRRREGPGDRANRLDRARDRRSPPLRGAGQRVSVTPLEWWGRQVDLATTSASRS